MAYLLAALEIPLPAFVHKESSQPFPCQNHPCGCRTAEQCWSHCCCFTPEQRWAWAREHHVDPPAYAEKPTEKPVENAAADGWNTPKLRDHVKGATESAARACCSAHRESASCCASRSPSPKATTASPGKPIRWATTMTAWRCQGYATLWVSVGAVLPVPATDWLPEETPPAAVALPASRGETVPTIPAVPPPRSFSV